MKDIKVNQIKPLSLDEDWSKLFCEMIRFRENCKDAKPKQNTEFMVYADNIYLYFAFKVSDNNVNPQRTRYNSKIFNEEVVEVFISGADIKKYLEFEVSPNNTQFCGLLKNSLKGRRHLKLLSKSIFESQVRIKSYGYDVLIKAKFKDICNKLNIRSLKECHFNAYRIDRPTDKEVEKSALNPTLKPIFHCPESFVKLIMD